MRPTRLLAALLLVAAACGSDDPGSDSDPITPGDGPDAAPPRTSCDDVTLEVGSGNREFTAVSPGDTVYLFNGPQGGYMFYVSVRARGIDPSNARLCYRDFVVDGGEDRNVGEGCWNIQLPNDLGGGLHERVGVWAQLDPSYWSKPGSVRDHDVRVDVTLSDTRGCSAQGGWSAHAAPGVPM